MILLFIKTALLLTVCYLKSNGQTEIKFYLMVESKKIKYNSWKKLKVMAYILCIEGWTIKYVYI